VARAGKTGVQTTQTGRGRTASGQSVRGNATVRPAARRARGRGRRAEVGLARAAESDRETRRPAAAGTVVRDGRIPRLRLPGEERGQRGGAAVLLLFARGQPRAEEPRRGRGQRWPAGRRRGRAAGSGSHQAQSVDSGAFQRFGVSDCERVCFALVAAPRREFQCCAQKQIRGRVHRRRVDVAEKEPQTGRFRKNLCRQHRRRVQTRNGGHQEQFEVVRKLLQFGHHSSVTAGFAHDYWCRRRVVQRL